MAKQWLGPVALLLLVICSQATLLGAGPARANLFNPAGMSVIHGFIKLSHPTNQSWFHQKDVASRPCCVALAAMLLQDTPTLNRWQVGRYCIHSCGTSAAAEEIPYALRIEQTRLPDPSPIMLQCLLTPDAGGDRAAASSPPQMLLLKSNFMEFNITARLPATSQLHKEQQQPVPAPQGMDKAQQRATGAASPRRSGPAFMTPCARQCFSWYTPRCWDAAPAPRATALQPDSLALDAWLKLSRQLALAYWHVVCQYASTDQLVGGMPCQQVLVGCLLCLGLMLLAAALYGCRRAATPNLRHIHQPAPQPTHLDQASIATRAPALNEVTARALPSAGPAGMLLQTPRASEWHGALRASCQLAGFEALQQGTAARRLSLNRTPPGSERKQWGRDEHGRLRRAAQGSPAWLYAEDSHQLRLYPDTYSQHSGQPQQQ